MGGVFTLTLTLSLEGEGILVSCVFDFVPTVTLIAGRRDGLAVESGSFAGTMGGVFTLTLTLSLEGEGIFVSCVFDFVHTVTLAALWRGGTRWRLVWLFCGYYGGRFTLTLTLSLEGEGIFVSCVFDFVHTVTLIAGRRDGLAVGLALLRLFRGAVHPHPNPLPRGRGDFCFLRVRFCPYRYPHCCVVEGG